MTLSESHLQENETSLFEKINPKIRTILESQGIVSPTTIQEKSYAPILDGHDIIAQSRTGSGKTIAFGLGAFAKLQKSGSKHPRLLVLTPTRELADQIGRVFNDTFGVLGFQTLAITGGSSYHFQKSRLSKGVDAIVATPGRFCDLLDQKSFSLHELEVLVLDEMDEMLDFGFSEDILRIKNAIGKKVQTLLFSATFPQKVEAIVKQMTQNPIKITVSPKDTSTGQIEHEFIEVRGGNRGVDALVGLLLYYNPEHAIIFCRTREETKNVSTMLSDRGFAASVLNGEMSQRDRSETMSRFKQKSIRLLIATDVAARGIDVSGLSHVINLNVPTNTDTYTHRAGRTGRAGATGKSWTIVAYNQRREYQFICSKLKMTPVRLELPNPKKILPKLLQNKLAELKHRASATSKTIKRAVEQYISEITPESSLGILQDILMHEMEAMAGNFADTDDIVPRELTEFGANVQHHHSPSRGGYERRDREGKKGHEKPARFFKEKRFSDTRKPYDKYQSNNKRKPQDKNTHSSTQRSGRSSSSWMG